MPKGSPLRGLGFERTLHHEYANEIAFMLTGLNTVGCALGWTRAGGRVRSDEQRQVTLVTDRKQPSHYCLSQSDELPVSINKRSAMTQVLTRINILFGLAALAISAGLVVAPALQEANAAEIIVSDAARVEEGQVQTKSNIRRRLTNTNPCWYHLHKFGPWWRKHRHCHDTRVRRPGQPR